MALTAIQRTDRIVRKDSDQIAVRMIEVDAQTLTESILLSQLNVLL